ncbi:MAG: TadE/TadG family type IV pilus assembly protein [Paracoccaceae bacterium]
MTLLSKICTKLQAFRHCSSGSSTVEFVLIAPTLLWFVFSVFEAGWLMTQQTMLARGLNMAIRDLRLGRIENATHEIVKARVCARARILRECMGSIHLELQPISLSTGVPQTSPSCVDVTGEITPAENFSTGVRDQEIMFIRACVVVKPLMPGMGLGADLTKDASGRFSLVAFSAFMNEG